MLPECGRARPDDSPRNSHRRGRHASRRSYRDRHYRHSVGGGTTTDANGKFAIAAAPGQRLSVSYIGYKETSVEVTTKTDYDIRLESDNAQIDEVIVVGYGTQKKVNVTGSVATIDSKAFDKRPIVSTSANITGEPTPKRLPEIAREIVDGVDYVVNPRFEGRPTGKPSSIIAFTEDGGVKVIRQ